MLNKEAVIRQLYRSEVLWLVYCCQSRALGKRITAPELPVGYRPLTHKSQCVIRRIRTWRRRSSKSTPTSSYESTDVQLLWL